MTATLRAAWRGDRNGRPGWYVVTSFDQALVDALKALPAMDRAWDPGKANGAGAWWISDLGDERLCELVAGFEAFLRQPQLF